MRETITAWVSPCSMKRAVIPVAGSARRESIVSFILGNIRQLRLIETDSTVVILYFESMLDHILVVD